MRDETGPTDRTELNNNNTQPGGLALAEIVTPAPRAEWAELLRRDIAASPGQSAAWTDAVASAGGWSDCSDTPAMCMVYPSSYSVARSGNDPGGIHD